MVMDKCLDVYWIKQRTDQGSSRGSQVQSQKYEGKQGQEKKGSVRMVSVTEEKT